MAWAGMKTNGPNCGCCCNDIYIRGNKGLELVRVTTQGTASTIANVPASPNNPISFDVDYFNRKVYYRAFPSSPGSLRRTAENLSDDTLFLAAPTGKAFSDFITVHSPNEHVFYALSDVPTTSDRYVHRIDYDTANDTEILVKDTGSAFGFGGLLFGAASIDDEYVFYLWSFDVSGSLVNEIWRMDADGANDQQIYAATSPEAVQSAGIVIDNNNEKIYFVLGGSVGTIGNRIYRTEFDGTNATLVFQSELGLGNLTLIRLSGYSHKNDRLYFFYTDTSPDVADVEGGLASVDPDGDDFRWEVDGLANWQTDTVNDQPSAAPLRQHLGCGFESMGEHH